MARKSVKKGLDLNGDGKFDKEDKSIAASVLASKIDDKPVVEEKKVVEPKVEGKVAVKDISRIYRAGSIVPQSQIELWKKSGINYEIWF